MFDFIFDTVFESAFAFQSLMLFGGGILCFGIGALLAGDFVYWRVKAKRSRGRITSFKEKPGSDNQTYYYKVAEFTDHQGNLHEIVSDLGSTYLSEKAIGKSIQIMYFKDSPEKARIKGSGWIGFIFGAIFAICGAVLFYFAIQTFKFGLPYLFVAIFLIVHLGWKFAKSIKPKDQWESVSSFKERKLQEWRQKKENYKDVDLREVKERHRELAKRQMQWSWLVLIIALGLCGGAYYAGQGIYELEQTGISVQGKVTGMDANHDGEGTTYSPIVSYQTKEGRKITFTSSFGSNPPMYDVGDEVDVLYDSSTPEENVMIDAGYWNWILPGILGAFGLFLLLIVYPSMIRAGNQAR